MDLLVAVDTAPVDDESRSGLWIVWSRRVPGLDVALLTEAGNPDLEEPLIGRAVRLVAVRTALNDGRMLPEKRPSFLGVAFITVLVNGILTKQHLRRGPMWVVAVAATHFSL